MGFHDGFDNFQLVFELIIIKLQSFTYCDSKERLKSSFEYCIYLSAFESGSESEVYSMMM